MKAYKKIITIILILSLIFTLIIIKPNSSEAALAIKTAQIQNYEIETKEVPPATYRMKNLNNIFFTTPSQTYDFIDEDSHYNLVYASKDNVYWTKYNENMQLIKEIIIKMPYNQDSAKEEHMEDLTFVFGNAIYEKGFLYVVYGNYIKRTENTKEKNVLAIVKYDKNGTEIKKSEITGYNLNTNPTSSYTATQMPFYSGECTLTINNGILAGLMARHISGGHETSLLFFVDTENLNWLSNANDTTQRDMTYAEATMKYNYTSHSFGQRIISTSDGGYVLMEVGDANPRGMVLTKLSKYYDTQYSMDRFKVSKFVPFHFREGGEFTHGNNYVYSVIGSLLEVSDGYLYIGASEKTLSRAYGNQINESWNLFTQKYKKDFENYNTQTMQMFTAPIRETTGVAPTDAKYNLYLTGNEKDYGIKWLTNYNNYECVISEVKAIPIEDKKIVLMWEEDPIKQYSSGEYYRTENERNVYYEIIDEDANVLDGPYKVEGVELNRQSNYTYKDGNIYWSTADSRSKTITIHKLAVGKETTYTLGDVNADGKINTVDVIMILQHISHKITLTETQIQAANTYKDSQSNLINTLDAIRILQYISHKITAF